MSDELQPLVQPSDLAPDEDNEHIEPNSVLIVENLHKLKRNTSSVSALMNFLKGSIGTGILALPIAFKYSGLWIGLFLLLFFGALSTYSMHVLLRTSESLINSHELDRSKIDYSEAVFNVFKYGPIRLRKYKGKFKHTVNIFLLITQIGFCCIYMIFISQNLQYVIKLFAPERDVSLYLIGLIATLFLIPACQIVNLRVLSVLSAIAMISTIIGLILIFVCIFFSGLKDVKTIPSYKPIDHTLIAFGIFVFTFEGVGLALPIRNRMINPMKFVFPFGVLNTAMVIVISLCSLLGFFGYLCFGEDTLGSITYNIPNSPIVYMFVKPLFIFAILISYLLQIYIPGIIFSRLMLKIRCYSESSFKRRSIYRKIMRSLIVLLTYAIAMAVPHLDLMVSLLGAVSSTVLALILPPLLEIVHLWPERDTIHNFWVFVFAKHTILIFIGVCSLIGGSLAAVVEIIRTISKS